VTPSLVPLTTRLRRRVAAAVAVLAAAVLPLAQAAPNAQADSSASAAAASGYWMVASDGGIFSFGTGKFFGSTGNIKLNQPIVGIAATPTGNGYWMVATDGGIFSFGDAKFFGSTGNIHLNKPIVGMASTPSGNGYWMVASDGGIFSFGDAKFFGSTGNLNLNKPIVGMTSSPSGNGYWMVASDGGIFSFGDAKFFGSTGSLKLNKPITAMASTPSGNGYWLTASDGGIFSYGDAKFFGAAPSRPAKGDRTVTAMVPSPDGAGYWQASTSGEILAFGSAPDLGGLTQQPARPVVGMTAVPAGTPGGTPGGTTNTTAPSVTTTTALPGGVAMPFSSTAIASWQTPPDPARAGYAQEVDAIAQYGNRVFIGGQFTNLLDANKAPANPPIAYLAELDATTGAPIPGSSWTANASPDGNVHGLAVSPDGKRLYVGGEFRNIGGQRIERLAALDINTGKADTSFLPPTPSAYVNAILPANGRVYIGGAWKTLGGVSQPELAALHDTDGSLDTAFVAPQDFGGIYETHSGKPTEDACNLPGATTPCTPTLTGVVGTLALTGDGSTLMVGGNWLHFGKAPGDPAWDYKNHGGLVALDPNTGSLTAWQPYSSRPGFSVAASPIDAHAVYEAAGGGGGVLVKYVVGNATGKPVWKSTVDGDATGVAVTATRVYLVGHYDHICQGDKLTSNTGGTGLNCSVDGPVHRHLAVFDHNGVLDPTFTGQANTPEGPDAVAIGPNGLYVGGNFTAVANQAGGGVRTQGGFALWPVQ
jgi:hypothetical protein